jgi:hypothetical protein
MKRVYVHPTAVIDKTAVRGDGIKVWHFVHTHTLMAKSVFRREKACKRVLILSVHALTEEDITDISGILEKVN